LNGRNLSALYQVVDSRERNPQVLGRLFYGKQIVNWSFAHSLRRMIDCKSFWPFYQLWEMAQGEDSANSLKVVWGWDLLARHSISQVRTQACGLAKWEAPAPGSYQDTSRNPFGFASIGREPSLDSTGSIRSTHIFIQFEDILAWAELPQPFFCFGH
jgi:hypothetical protein